MSKPLRVRQATERGWIEVPVGGVFDGTYATSLTRRGRVQGGGELSPTITASGEIYRYEGYVEEQEVGDDAEDGR